jgi:glycosyltransferase involved in cell wall biosynthesis
MRIQDLVSGAQSPAELFINAVCEQAKSGSGLPYALTFAPLAQINPFQRLLYCRAAQAGYAVVPTVHFTDLASVNWGGRSVIHLHWLASVLAGCDTKAETQERIATFEREMIRWRRGGHKILWTLHNVLPHNTRFPEAEIALRQVLVTHSDAIHILSEQSVDEARKYYDIPDEKVFFVPHPSYEGWYANVGDTTTARLDLGIDPDDFTFVQFGALQPYKGVLELVEAFRSLKQRHPLKRFRLVVAGNPADKEYVGKILEAVADVPEIRLIQSAMQEKEIQTLFNAADVLVAPYVKTLNSGVSLLAATFRKPLVAPNVAGVAQTFAADSSLLYSGGDGDSLFDALDRSLSYRIADTVFEQILDNYRPARISSHFFETVTLRLFAPQTDSQGAGLHV